MRCSIVCTAISAALIGAALTAACASDSTPPVVVPPAPPPPPPPPPTACTSGLVPEADGTCIRPGVRTCAAGFMRDSSGFGCIELAATDCAAGTRARIGETSCLPAGWTDCPAGFVPDGSGYACEAVLAPSACSGATRESIGEPGCLPFAGCDETFPPAGATIFVDANFPLGQVDATHHQTISAAIAAAPAGATIAVAAGTYREDLLITKPLTLAGLCARDTSVTGTGAALPGIWVRGGNTVTLRNLEVAGHDGGIEIDGGATVTVEETLVASNARSGVLVHEASTLVLSRSAVRASEGRGLSAQTGATVTLEDVVFGDNHDIGVYASGAGTRIGGGGVIVRETTPSSSGERGWGLAAFSGSAVELTRSVFLGNTRSSVRASDPGSSVTLGGAIMRACADGASVTATGGSTLHITGGVVEDNAPIGIIVQEGSNAELSELVVRRTRILAGDPRGALAFVALGDARAKLTRAVFSDNDVRAVLAEGAAVELSVEESLIEHTQGDLAPGLAAADGAKLDVFGSSVVDSGSAGMIVDVGGSPVTLRESVIETTRPFPGTKTGGGLIMNSGIVTVERSAFRANYSGGIIVGDNDGKTARLDISDSSVHGSVGRSGLPADATEGFGIWVSVGSTLAISRCHLAENELAALGVQHGARAEVDECVFHASRPDKLGNYGEGIYSEGYLQMEDSAVLGNRTIGLHVNGDVSFAKVTRSLIDATEEKSPGVFGHGVAVVFAGALDLRASELRGSKGAGLVVGEGAVLMSSSVVRANTVGLHVQAGTTLNEVRSVPELPEAGKVLISEDTQFLENATKLGAGVVPLPDAIDGPM